MNKEPIALDRMSVVLYSSVFYTNRSCSGWKHENQPHGKQTQSKTEQKKKTKSNMEFSSVCNQMKRHETSIAAKHIWNATRRTWWDSKYIRLYIAHMLLYIHTRTYIVYIYTYTYGYRRLQADIESSNECGDHVSSVCVYQFIWLLVGE